MSDYVRIDGQRIALDGEIYTKGDLTSRPSSAFPALLEWLKSTNWKTSVSGFVGLAMGFVMLKPEYFPPVLVDIAKYVGLGAGGIFVSYSKDKDKDACAAVPAPSAAPGGVITPADKT